MKARCYNGRLTSCRLEEIFPGADWRKILAVACKWGKNNNTLTQELIQEAVIKVLVQDGDKPCAYYTVIAKNAMVDHIRKEKRREQLERVQGFNPDKMVSCTGSDFVTRGGNSGGESDDGKCADVMSLRTVIQNAFGNMNESERTIIEQVAAGVPLADIADSEGRTTPAIKSQIHRLQTRMRNFFPDFAL